MQSFTALNLSLYTLRIGIDIGGTFTDFVQYDPLSGAIETFKLLSTPQNPAEAVLVGLERIYQSLPAERQPAWLDIIHGSTVATNALLERKGSRTAFIATRGFGDLLQIGRQNRPALYDLFADPPPSLAPPELRFEVDERVDYLGQALQTLDPAQVESLLPDLYASGVESVAVCLLFSFLHPEHEQTVARILRSKGYPVSVSCEILPEFREYERASTTMVNAYVSPVVDGYLSHLEQAIETLGCRVRLQVMQSNGGNLSVAEARRAGVRCILSGPAGGVVGAAYTSRQARLSLKEAGRFHELVSGDSLKLIPFDMGGTSTDVALIDGEPQITTEAQVGGCPIHIPMLDIHTIGAGGGSIARVDLGGALRVGPQSAGADPGPACYGRGDLPTVTDANLVLGRLAPDYFLGGQMSLDLERARGVMARLGVALGLDAVHTALGVVEVVNAHMERALRVISVERGHDPRLFTLLSFGGAGGLHAVDLARRLGIRSILVPPLASTLSALGMLSADVVRDASQTVMLPGNTSQEEIAARLTGLIERVRPGFGQNGFPSGENDAPVEVIETFVDMRYVGQSYELTVAFGPDLQADFHEAHQRAYGYSRPQAQTELVNLRARLTHKTPPPVLPELQNGGTDPIRAHLGRRPVALGRAGRFEPVDFYRWEALRPGNQIQAPAVVIRNDTTIFLERADQVWVDVQGNLWIQVGE